MSKNYMTLAISDARLARAQHLLVDLDGTLVRQQEAIAGAVELLAHFDGRYAIVSNNSTHTASGLAQRLRRLGLRVPVERIVLAGEQAVRQLVLECPGARVMMVASPALQRYARTLGCQLVRSDADFVLLALDMRFDHARLALAANELRRGARLVASNADLTHPGTHGRVVPETGALLAALVAASGVQPLRITGKPAPLLFEEGLHRLNARAEDTVVVGDNPLTDAEGAQRLGMACVLVGTAPGAVAPSVAGLFAAPAGSAEAPDALSQYRLSDSTSKVWRSVRTEVS
ncbi:HAD-IIA family hydrolase [Variovorax ginsengisoli]|uniref:HAD superfamily hydrolase (TIGR01450 family) n=1 Tax=Variovorax ginsengisoli TaxID=363844 RepID=A0ABT9S9A2_9BURK|nr:HAD-IIA family hydrolase [Variovorax ginsengisoli]MDP9900938.1 HAD superfamily hydrolase (TIGR01450 family) [Variovorax ginsengisoli]